MAKRKRKHHNASRLQCGYCKVDAAKKAAKKGKKTKKKKG
jgi:hypothetical protein